MRYLKYSVFASAIVACAFATASDRGPWTPQQNPPLLKACQESIAVKREKYKALYADQKYMEAANLLSSCRYVWETDEIDKLVDKAEIQKYVSIIKDPQTNPLKRDDALYWLRSDHPEAEKLFPKDYARLDRENRAQEARRAEEARRPKYDIKIGMRAVHVLYSKWGAPLKVNKTIDADGTHEQWVYSDNRYLYFYNDRLTTIQTSAVSR